MLAARTGNMESVNVLLRRGAGVDARENTRGQTALMWAATEGHADVVRALIDRGADVNRASRFQLVAEQGFGGGGRGKAGAPKDVLPGMTRRSRRFKRREPSTRSFRYCWTSKRSFLPRSCWLGSTKNSCRSTSKETTVPPLKMFWRGFDRANNS